MSDEELPRVLALLWGREAPGRRGPKPGFSIHELGAAAVHVADTQGLPAVSMNAVAKQLGLTTMALYRYVDSKSDLLVAMVDAAYGPPPKQPVTGGWRKQLQSWASSNRAALRRHPWIVQIPVSEPPLAPNQLRWMDRGLRAFARTPLTQQEKLSSLLLAEVFVRGQVLLSSQIAGAVASGPLNEREANEVYARRLVQLATADSLPYVHAALVSGSLQDEGDFAEEEFLFGLQTVLDGIEARIARHKPGRRKSNAT